MDGVEQPNHAQQVSAEERLAAQAKEIQELREQLARVAVKEGPRFPHVKRAGDQSSPREAPAGAVDETDAVQHQGIRTA